MSAIKEEITAIEAELQSCFDNDTPINPAKVKRLCELRGLRLRELVSTHQQRIEIMKTKSRELTEKLATIDLSLHPELEEKLTTEKDKFDEAALLWVNDGLLSSWESSLASSIAAGLLILANS